MNNVLIIRPSVFPVRFPGLNAKRAFWLLAIPFAFSLLIFYIIQVNSLTKERYLLGSQQHKIENLSAHNDNLKIDFSKLASLDNVEGYVLKENFEKTSNLKFIQISENQVAKR